ncbi:hypothetical protein Ga0080574_TMP3463 [Salipiger abyssi]|uniref:Uncharacterized protein n=1 Tax=Salipiger abyssi TaxID=1250539 RepID=A0A1P8UWN3_9RHOB|nr:hypothetical protein Ga0080574_TMP3463 [Salipiger abyssi]
MKCDQCGACGCSGQKGPAGELGRSGPGHGSIPSLRSDSCVNQFPNSPAT